MFTLIVISVAVVCARSASIPNGLIPVYNPRIVGGEHINITDVPYMVAVVYYGAQYCGGALITDSVVLTAAHCTPGITERRTKIRVGTSWRSSGGSLLPIRKILPHEDYQDYIDGKDIALIFLVSPVIFSDTIQKIALPELGNEPEDDDFAIVTGWGYLSTRGPSSEHLMVVVVPIVNRKRCYDAFHDYVNEEMICAGFSSGGKDACQMDSGGPLMYNDTVVGIVSWGNGCATPDFYGVYTNVAYFHDWIMDQIEKYTLK